MTYSPFRHIGSVFRKHEPIHLTVFLTRRCNASCPFCFYAGGQRKTNGSDQDNHELGTEEYEHISSSMGKLLWLAFSGGEIFLRRDIVELTKIFYRNNKPSIMLFPTNGLLTGTITEKTGEILRNAARSTVVVKLSFEGTEEVHDSIRGKGSFQSALRTYRELSGYIGKYPNFELGVNTVFLSRNQDHMDELFRFVRSLDHIKTHTVSLIRGDIPDVTLKDIDMRKYRNAIKTLESNLKDTNAGTYSFTGARLKAAQDIVQRRYIHETALRQKQLIPCYAGKLNLVLTETGDVFPCETFSLKMGNVRDFGNDMIRVLRSGKAQKVLRSIHKKRCFCTHECFMMTNILFNPRTYPSLLLEYLQIGKKRARA